MPVYFKPTQNMQRHFAHFINLHFFPCSEILSGIEQCTCPSSSRAGVNDNVAGERLF